MKVIALGTRVGALAALAAASIDELVVKEDPLSKYLKGNPTGQETQMVIKKANKVSQAKRRKHKRQRGK